MSIDDPLNSTDMRTMKAAIALEQIKALGLDLNDLVALSTSGELPGQVTFHDYVPVVREATTADSRRVYDTYWELLDIGLPDFCACMCPPCVAAAGADKARRRPCPCRISGSCACPKADLGHGPDVASCADGYYGIGHKVLSQILPTDISVAMAWAKLRAMKRWAGRNDKRAANGRATYDYTGKSAQEHTRAAASNLFSKAVDDPSTGVTTNVALKVKRVKRPKTTARAYTVPQLEELWDAIFTCGLDDPELAMLVWWFHIETGARRDGGISLRISGLNHFTQMVRLVEKGETVNDQPVSAELLRALLGHALERGGIVIATTDGLDPARVTVEDLIAGRATVRTDAPVFYYRKPKKATLPDGRVIDVPHPMTRRFYNTVWNRICTALPWADQLHIRPHDLRKTGAQWIERAHGYSVAKGWLRHAVDDHTLTYTRASDEQIARAVETLTGRSHPLASGPDIDRLS